MTMNLSSFFSVVLSFQSSSLRAIRQTKGKTKRICQHQTLLYQQSRSQRRRQIPAYCHTRLFASSTSDLIDVKRQFQTAIDLYESIRPAPAILASIDATKAELEKETADPSFWDSENKVRNAYVTAQLSKYSRLQNRLREWKRWKEDGEVALDMLSQAAVTENSEESDVDPPFTKDEYESLVEELQNIAQLLLKDGERYQLELLLSGEYDEQPCIIKLTAGAGGTEANDWVADLKRMYERHAERIGYVLKIVDQQLGDVVGYKSVEMMVSSTTIGDGVAQHPYGWFKGEKGSHRLVRLSPFNANNKRQTTFAGVDVVPIFLNEDKLSDIVIPDKDLEITTMRSGGAGGQNVNKVNSAVRIKHLPSGLNVKCTQERSQAMNKDLAMKRLKAQLLAIAKEQRVAEIQEIRGDQVEASWGTQIRNYVMHPYKLIKDQRTGWETSNIQNFMDGDLEDCIANYLKTQAEDDQKTSLRGIKNI